LAALPVSDPSRTAHISDAEIRRANYMIRHWRGDLSLSVSLWVNLCFLSLGFGLVAGLFFEYPSLWPKNYIAFCILVYTAAILGLAMPFWQMVGVWRSAKKLTDSGGRQFWARLAQLAVICYWTYWSIFHYWIAVCTVAYFSRHLFRNLWPRLGRGPGRARIS
jgi:hypothetical protein